MHTSFLLPLLAALAANAAQLIIQSPRITVSGSDGSQLRSEPISLKYKLGNPVELGPTDTLKLTFQVAEKGSEQGVQPHQTFLRFFDETTGEEGVQPVKVSSAGKAKFELNMARPPTSLPPSGDAPFKVSLILGSFVHSPAKFDIFDLAIPVSLPPPQHPEEPSFHPLPEIQHTFRPDQKLPPAFISAVFTGLVISPWVVLIGLWGIVHPRVPRLFSLNILPFTLSLTAVEVLLFWYWVEFRLGQVLLYGAGAALVTAFTGKRALGSIAARRVGSK